MTGPPKVPKFDCRIPGADPMPDDEEKLDCPSVEVEDEPNPRRTDEAEEGFFEDAAAAEESLAGVFLLGKSSSSSSAKSSQDAVAAPFLPANWENEDVTRTGSLVSFLSTSGSSFTMAFLRVGDCCVMSLLLCKQGSTSLSQLELDSWRLLRLSFSFQHQRVLGQQPPLSVSLASPRSPSPPFVRCVR